MAEDPNDVVRHVILRILVDQAGLAESIAAARGKLKELEKGEHESNDNRVKDAGRVEKSYDKQRESLDKTGETVRERTKEDLSSADQVDKAHQRAFERDISRFNAEKKAARDLEKDKLDAGRKTTADLEKIRLNAAQADRNATQKAISDQQKLNQQLAANQHVITDAENVRAATQATRVETLIRQAHTATEKLEADTVAAEHLAETRRHQSTTAGHEATQAATAADVAAQRAIAEVTDRRVRSLRDARTAQQSLRNLSAEGNVLEQAALSIAQQRTLAEARTAQQIEKQAKGLKGFIQGFGNVLNDTAVTGGRLVATAPRSAARGAREAGQEFDRRGVPSFGNPLHDVVREASGGEKVIAGFFRAFGKGSEDGLKAVAQLKGGFKAFFEDLNRSLGGTGENILSKFALDIFNTAESLNVKLGDMGRHFASMETIILAVVAALGPLAAILGAVGAAALGVASNIVALSGSLVALPGILTAIVGGFGALAIVMKPLTTLFSDYSAAQKEATSSTQAATSAALDYADAQLQQADAETAYHRAQQDQPRLLLALADARKQATRTIEDYRAALKRLKFDQEGSDLDVQSAKEQARRALADPTASTLDRKEAIHNLQGALLDQQDQATNAKRTRQDASEAFAKGVDGSDQVVAANRAVEDSANKVKEAYDAWQKSIIATKKAALLSDAGGNSAMVTYLAQLNKLPPQTRIVAEAILALIKQGGPFSKLRDKLSENIFGPVSKDTGKFKDILNTLGTFLTPISVALGKIAKSAVEWLDSPAWKDFFATQGKASAGILTDLFEAGMSVADAFTGIITAATPFTSYLVGAIKGVAGEFDKWTKTTSGQNGIVNFLDTTKKRIQEIWPIIKNFAAGFAGFFEALNTPGKGDKEDFTTKFNKGLLGASKTFKALGEEAANPNSGFRKWLADVGPLLKTVAHFLGSAAGFFGKLFSDPRNITEARNILKELADKWLPRLSDIFGQIAASGLISKLATAIGRVFNGIDTFLKNGGSDELKKVAGYIETAGTVLGGLITAFSSIPGIIKVIGGVIATVFGVSLLAKFSGLTGLLKGIFGLIRTIIGITANVRNIKLQQDTESGSGRSGGKGGTAGSSGKKPTNPKPGGGESEDGFGNRTPGRTVGPVGGDVNKPSRFSRFTSGVKGVFTRDNQPVDASADTRNTTRRGGVGASTVKPARQSVFSRLTGGGRRFFGSTKPFDENGEQPDVVDSTRNSKPGRLGTLGRTVKSEITGAVTGSTQTGSTLSRIEGYTRQIELNTRRGRSGASGGAGSTSSRSSSTRATSTSLPGGGTPGTDDDDRRSRNTAHAGTVSLGQSGEGSVRSRIDASGTVAGGLGRAQTTGRRGATLGYSTAAEQANAKQFTDTYSGGVTARDTRRHPIGVGPATDEKPVRSTGPLSSPDTVIPAEGQGSSRRAATTSGYSSERAAANVRRAKVGLKPLPPDITSSVPSSVNQSTPVESEAGGTIPYVPGSPRDRERQAAEARAVNNSPEGRQGRLDAAARSESARAAGTGGVIPFTDEETTRQRKNSPGGRAQRLNAIAASAQARAAGGGTVPRLDPEPAKPAKPESPAERRRRRAAERATAAALRTNPVAGTPLTDVGRDLGPYGIDERDVPGVVANQSVPTAEQSANTGKVKPPQDPETGRITSPYDEATRNIPGPSAAFPGGEKPKKKRPKQRRNAKGQLGPVVENQSTRRTAVEEALHSSPSPVDEGVETGGAEEQPTSTKRKRLRDRLFPAGDEGSVGLGIGTRPQTEEPSSRRSKTTRSKPGGKSKRGKGLLGGLLTGLGGLGGADDEYDDGYNAGYNDAEGQSGGSSSSSGGKDKDGKKKPGKGGKGRRGAAALEDEVEEATSGGKGKGGILSRIFGRGGKGAAGVAEEGLEDLGKGGGKGLLGKLGGLGGGLLKGAGGLAAGAAISGGLELGGNYLANKFVKNDKDRGSVTRAVGAISQGATIGSTIGSFLGPAGGAVGGLIGGAAGGIYSLFKDKNLREFVEKKLAVVGDKIASGFKTAATAVGHFFEGIGHFFADVGRAIGKTFSDIGKGIGHFFESIGKYAERSVKFVVTKFLEFLKFWYVTLPTTVFKFLFETLPGYIGKAVAFAVEKFLELAKFWFVTLPTTVFKFLFETLPGYIAKAVVATVDKFLDIAKFFFITLPEKVGGFFINTLPGLVVKGFNAFKSNLIDPVLNWITGIPAAIGKTVPQWFATVGTWFNKHIVQPFVNFFTGLAANFSIADIFLHGASKLIGFFKTFFSTDDTTTTPKKMSGGLIDGVYQGIQDTAHIMATPGEFMVRKTKVDEPGAKMFLRDFNERGMEALYGGLSASTRPPVMSMVPPQATTMTGAIPTIVNNTINHAPVMGDVTIHNPVREKSEATLRRQIHIAAIRHRR